jgi:hypothetical protein
MSSAMQLIVSTKRIILILIVAITTVVLPLLSLSAKAGAQSASSRDTSSQTDSSPQPKFKSEFHGIIDTPESPTYRVIHDNVIARGGPNTQEDELFRLRQQDAVKALAEYTIKDDIPDDELARPKDALSRTWVKFTTSSGQTGFVEKVHLLTPKQFEAWTLNQKRMNDLAAAVKRLKKENAGPHASFAGIYCYTTSCKLPLVAGSLHLNWGMSYLQLMLRYLIWFDGNTIHQFQVGSGKELVGTMRPDGRVSFNSKAPPFNGVHNLPSYRISFNNGSSEKYAFNKHGLFYLVTGTTGSFKSLSRGSGDEINKMLDDYMPKLGEYMARISKASPVKPASN